jgi:hypothetical protein
MAESSAIQAAREALDVARYVGDIRRIAAAKLALVRAIAATEPHPDTALMPLSDIRRAAQLVPDTTLKLEFVGWLQDEFPL